jgi:hypothetical protein
MPSCVHGLKINTMYFPIFAYAIEIAANLAGGRR